MTGLNMNAVSPAAAGQINVFVIALPAVRRAPLIVMVLPALKKSHPSHNTRVPSVIAPVS